MTGGEGKGVVVPFSHIAVLNCDEEARRRNFEQGRIDYTGADRFDLLIQPQLDALIPVQDDVETLSGNGSEDVLSEIAVPSSEDPMLQDGGDDPYRLAVLVTDEDEDLEGISY